MERRFLWSGDKFLKPFEAGRRSKADQEATKSKPQIRFEINIWSSKKLVRKCTSDNRSVIYLYCQNSSCPFLSADKFLSPFSAQFWKQLNMLAFCRSKGGPADWRSSPETCFSQISRGWRRTLTHPDTCLVFANTAGEYIIKTRSESAHYSSLFFAS